VTGNDGLRSTTYLSKTSYFLLNNHTAFTPAVDHGVTSMEILNLVQKYTIYTGTKHMYFKYQT